jgi:hypothetical protein
MRKWLVWGTLLLLSCAACSAERSVVTASATASPTTTLKCRLPVFLNNGNPGEIIHPPNGSLWGTLRPSGAGFVGFPGGQFTTDPAGNLIGYFGRTYDWAVLKWLPIWPDAVAPDGLSYFIPNNETAQWDLVDARNDSHRALVAVKDWNARSYQKEGIYLDKDGGESAGPPGLWLLDPSTGAIRQITSQGPWVSIGAGAAWGFEGYGDGSVGTTLRRLDLKSGDVTTWYASDGADYQTFGHDLVGRPLLVSLVTPSPKGYSYGGLFELAALGQLVKLASTNGDSLSVPVSDQHGIWFAIGTGVWLYSNGLLHKVASLPGDGAQPAGTASAQVIGTCSSGPA